MSKSKIQNPIKYFLSGKVLILIDAANLEVSVKDLGWHIDYLKLRDLFNHHQLIQIRHYCVRHNTENQNRFFTFLKHAGYKLVTKPLKIIKDEDIKKGDIRKANFDVETALDAHAALDNFNTLVLFSGDSDFDFLVKTLRAKGKRVVVISTKYHISRELIASSNKYIDLKKLRPFIARRYAKQSTK